MRNKTGLRSNLRNIKIIREPVKETDIVNKEYAVNFIDEAEHLKILDDNTIVRNDQNNDFKNNTIINVNKIQINNEEFDDKDVVNKKYINDLNLIKYIDKNDDYIKVNILDNNYYLRVFKEDWLLDHTSYIIPNTGDDLLPIWELDSLDSNGIQNNNIFS